MYRWFLALRYLLRRPINVLGVIGVMLGVWALIVVVAIFSGYIAEVRNHVRATTSDIAIDNLPPDCSFADVRAVLERDPNVASCAPRIAWAGMLHPTRASRKPDPTIQINHELGEGSPFVHLLGIDPVAELEVSGLRGWLGGVEGQALRVDPARLLAPQDGTPALLLSERRTKVEGITTSDRARITCARIHQMDAQSVEMQHLDLRLQGAFASKYVLFDTSTAIVSIDTMRQLIGTRTPDACNFIAVKLRDPSQDRATAARLDRAIDEALGYRPRVQDWEAVNFVFLSAVSHQRTIMKFVLFVIMVVAAFLMFATLWMMVTEKLHDIGILSAMGGTRLGVMQVFVSCGLAISLAGTALGIIAGCISAMYLDAFNTWMRATFDVDLFPTSIYNLRSVPYELDPLWIAQVAAMALGVGAFVSAVPAWYAARHDPVESLRAE